MVQGIEWMTKNLCGMCRRDRRKVGDGRVVVVSGGREGVARRGMEGNGWGRE